MGKDIKEEALKNIIEGCQKRDRRSQKELYQRFSPILYGIALRFTGNEDDAKDLLQEGFLKIFDKIDKYNFSGSFEGWVKRVFVNFVIDSFKKKKNVEYRDEISNNDYNELVDDNFYTLEESELSKLKIDVLLKMIDKLPPAYKLVFNMYVFEGYSHKEIGKILGISENTSKSNYSRARQKLKKMIEIYIKTKKL
jgi:RNA polymerase sigma factor (sigma-70 family)